MKRCRRTVPLAAALALALLLPPAARALLGVAGEPRSDRAPEFRLGGGPGSPGGARRPVLVRKVDKAVVRAPAGLGAQTVGEGPDLEAAPPLFSMSAAPASFPRLTQPGAIRIFLTSTPHNHRAPPAA